MRTMETTVYEFDELSDAAKEKAREWFRTVDEFDSDYPIDDWKGIVACLGLKTDKVYWSGFWSQGDGACFEGQWRADNVDLAKLRANYPQTKGNEWIYSLADTVARRAAEYPNLVVNVSHKGRYYHANSMEFDAYWWDEGDRDVPDMDRDGDVPDMLRDMAIALYRRLCEDYEYSQSDECVDDGIRSNEYTFTADGQRFG